MAKTNAIPYRLHSFIYGGASVRAWGFRFQENGQITVPVEIRRLLGLKSGDKILFLQKQNGEIVVSNASAQAIRKAQAAFSGVAEEMDVYKEEDIQALVDEVRYGKER